MIFNRETGTKEGLSFLVGQPRIPSWNTEGRPKNPRKGTFGFNSQTHNLEFWNGSRWLSLGMILEDEQIPNGLGEVIKEFKKASKNSSKKNS